MAERTRVIGDTNRGLTYEVSVKKPLDARSVVKTYADLTNKYNWQTETEAPIAYNGMIVAVWADSEASNNGIYFLHDPKVTTAKGKPNVEDYSNWHKLCTVANLEEELSNIETAPEEESDVLTYGYRTGFPVEGESNKLYVAADEGKTYIWFNNEYLPVGGSEGIYEEPDIIHGGSQINL